MSLFTIERNGYSNCQLLAYALIGDLINNGFSLKFPGSYGADTYKATLEVTSASDPLFATQPWRIHIDADSIDTIKIAVGTSVQLDDAGNIAFHDDGFSIAGGLEGSTSLTFSQKFVDRIPYDVGEKESYPMSYKLTIVPQGLALCIWEPANNDIGNSFSWFTVQRPVNNVNGAIRQSGRAPVHCLFGIHRPTRVGGGNSANAVQLIQRFVVRESDVSVPTQKVDATIDTPDYNRVINSKQMVSITEANNYVVAFPKEVNTPRFAYPGDELDLIGYSSADVIAESSLVSLNLYGEGTARSYKALQSNGVNNTGMRIFMLHGGGVF